MMFYPAPRELQPDRMSLFSPMYMISRRPAPIETVAARFRRTGRRRGSTIRDHRWRAHHGSSLRGGHELRTGRSSLRAGQSRQRHADGLSAEGKDADQCGSVLAAGARAQPPAAPTAGMLTLYQNMRKYKLDVAQHVPIHGRVGTNEEFVKLLGNKASKTELSPQ